MAHGRYDLTEFEWKTIQPLNCIQLLLKLGENITNVPISVIKIARIIATFLDSAEHLINDVCKQLAVNHAAYHHRKQNRAQQFGLADNYTSIMKAGSGFKWIHADDFTSQ